MNSNLIYLEYFIGILFLITSLINLYKYFKMQENHKNYVEIKGIVTYVNTIFTGNKYRTYSTYKYEYNGNTYEAYDRGFGKNLKKLNDEVVILINSSNPKKYLPPMKYEYKDRYLIYGIMYLILFISVLIKIYIYK